MASPHLTDDALPYVFHHLFLPPKLPGGDDASPSVETQLIQFVLDSLRLFRDNVESDAGPAVDAAIDLMQNMEKCRTNQGHIYAEGMKQVFQQLASIDTESYAAIHVTAQNAGVLFQTTPSSAIIQPFELSPRNESVYRTQGRLVRQFPATAVEVPRTEFCKAEFQAVLANTLEKMCQQSEKSTKHRVKKAGQMHDEERETVSPVLVTELLVAFLRGCGNPIEVDGISKKTREDVIWANDKLPWRRSPLWLLIRVSLQLTMSRVASDSGATFKSFMVLLLSKALHASIDRASSDTLHTMRTKIARRLLKMEKPREGLWLQMVQKLLAGAASHLDDKWQQIGDRLQPPLDLKSLPTLPLEDDVRFHLPYLDQFLPALLSHDEGAQAEYSHPTSRIQPFHSGSLPFPPTHLDSQYKPFVIFMMESWAATCLDQWVEEHLASENSCANFSRLIREYHELGKEWYSNRPEGASRMQLTILELWIAADRCVVHAFPLLREYRPEVPVQVYQDLLLHSRADMARIQRSENYLQARLANAIATPRPSIFRVFGHVDSFQNRYFSQSSKHQALLQQIEAQAETEREAKLSELRNLQQEYQRLMRRYREGTCQMVEVEDDDGEMISQHSPWCSRCRFHSQAQSLSIAVHEWPLSANQLEAQATVFELDLPPVFGAWRDLTIYLIDDVLRSEPLQRVTPAFFHPLGNYTALTKFSGFWATAATGVYFNKPETATFFLQLSLQAGPNEADVLARDTHGKLGDLHFGQSILNHLELAITRIERNWESYLALWTFSFLTTRLLTMTASEELRIKCLDLLERSQDISHQWMADMKGKINIAVDIAQKAALTQALRAVSLVCVNSFNVDDIFLAKMLSISHRAAILIEASAQIHNNSATQDSDTAVIHGLLHDRWQHILHRARPILAREISNGNACLDVALPRLWPAFVPSSCWTLAPKNWYWFEGSSAKLKVHFNMLTGELLVNGKPLSRLPREYEDHAQYRQLFEHSSLEVMPSPLKEMEFSSTRSFAGNTVHFNMVTSSRASGVLRVHLEKDGSTHDLVPQRFFMGLLPDAFVSNFVHWYCPNGRYVEFRPVKSRWTSCSSNWRLVREKSNWTLTQGADVALIAPGSQSGRYISNLLRTLETPLRLHLLFNTRSGVLDVEIPNLDLGFQLRRGGTTLVSRQFRGMEIDDDQAIQTLVGLQSKLVLRDGGGSRNRVVLVPEGEVFHEGYAQDVVNTHTKVSIVSCSASRVQAYTVDNLLGRLVDNDTVQSKLFLAYLHVLTSSGLPDPLLRRTGTEQAISILESASVRSMTAPTERAMHMLEKIASLTPTREFYPRHEKTMQVVKWSSKLSFLAQSGRFWQVVKGLIEGITTLSFLYPDHPTMKVSQLVTIECLNEREILRNSAREVAGFGAGTPNTSHDSVYQSRDRKQESDRAIDAGRMAVMVFNNDKFVLRSLDQVRATDLYARLTSRETTPTIRNRPSKQSMAYDSMWLQSPSQFLPSLWCSLHYAFQEKPNWLSKFELMIWLASVAYSEESIPSVTQALFALSNFAEVSVVPIPALKGAKLSEGHAVNRDSLCSIVQGSLTPLWCCPENQLQQQPSETSKAFNRRRNRDYNANSSRAANSFVQKLVRQWPCPMPQKPTSPDINTYIHGDKAMGQVQKVWKTWHDNLIFFRYLEDFVGHLERLPRGNRTVSPLLPLSKVTLTCPGSGLRSIDELFATDASFHVPPASSLPVDLLRVTTSSENSSRLGEVLDVLESRAKLDCERHYLLELRDSLSSLQKHDGMGLHGRYHEQTERAQLFQRHLSQCSQNVDLLFGSMAKATGSDFPHDTQATVSSVAFEAGLWPRISPVLFLQQLARNRWNHLSSSWKEKIVAYANAITHLQQARRLVQFQDNEVDLIKELENSGPKPWSPFEFPEWLLLECESGMRIRDAQQRIARHMMEPRDAHNAVMQLNMGEGKSSIIVPIITAALSDSSRLVRAVVAKPQSKQMAHFLTSKLSGLLDRPVVQLPFSRAIVMDGHRADIISNMAVQCMKDGGVMMVQPEHLLSFQLMGLETQINGNPNLSRKLLDTQRFFDTCSRDVVDESDENFSVKFELIYTLGQQRPIEHSPDRWGLIQEVLALVAKLSLEVKDAFPQSIERDARHPGGFPRIRILQNDAGGLLLSRLAEQICDTGITGFPVARQSRGVREAVLQYISHAKLSPEEIEAVEKSPFWIDSTISNILLLRGLVAGGILAFAFGLKRWRVNYGTNATREKKTRLAVPFRAKDLPTPRSEFSHPDVVIVLTCLSYYYGGLENEDLFGTLELLVASDNADLEYQIWTQTAPGLPQSFRHLKGINLRDRVQCKKEVFPHLRYSKGAIDYFLSHKVFAKESKEFPHKLTASGWDLGKVKANKTTGFSGTNDSRYVLPLDVEQLDLAKQKHTNALVLENLLRPENDTALIPSLTEGANSDCELLLDLVAKMDPNTRVILDVGAQIIDLANKELASTWLKMYDDKEKTQAVVFFSEADELMVLDRSGRTEELQTSPFAKQMDRCLVFLDEGHTRGTDLKLPENYRAAVTLGANLTKDRLVQACMRMRKLGKGQSVTFCIPEEIQRKMLSQCKGSQSTPQGFTVSDVICWAIAETWIDLRRAVPLWVTQGLRFHQQDAVWRQYEATQCLDQESIKQWACRFLEDEAETIDHRYRPLATQRAVSTVLQGVDANVATRFQERCDQFGITESGMAALQEEQERELSPEAEEERQVERPPVVKPETHMIHAGVRYFVAHGKLPENRLGFKPAFATLRNTSAAKHIDVGEFPARLWVTDDFARTVQTQFGRGDLMDSFQRPCQWVLASHVEAGTAEHLVVISPFEAQELLPAIGESSHVTLCLYSPRVNLGFASLEGLDLYTVPRRATKLVIPLELKIQLNLFAGQLHLTSFHDYTDVCAALGLASCLTGDDAVVEADGFIPPGSDNGTNVNTSGFSKSPVKFMKVFMARIRQNCEGVEKTHMGRILDGILLKEDDFEEHVE